ncbi:hypothetical protein ACGF5M_03055 [Gemmatimonadota bacterium]
MSSSSRFKEFALPTFFTATALFGMLPFALWVLSPSVIQPDPGGDSLAWARMLHITTDLPGLGFWSRIAKPLAYGLIGLGVAVSGTLGIITTWVGHRSQEAKSLAPFLCLFPLALGVEYLWLPYPESLPFLWWPPWVVAMVGAGAFAGSFLGLLRFAIGFPTPLSEEQLDAYFDQTPVSRWMSQQEHEKNRRNAPVVMRVVQAPLLAALSVALFAVAKLTHAMAFYTVVTFGTFGVVIGAYMYFKVGLKVRPVEERRRILWIYGGMLASIITMSAIGILPFALVPIVGEMGYALYWMFLAGYAPFLGLVVFLLALAVAVFYQGAIDPRLTIKRTTVYGALGVLFLFLFAGIGNFVEDAVQQFSGMSGGIGSIVTGGLIAVVVLPLKGRFSNVADRYLPKVERDR